MQNTIIYSRSLVPLFGAFILGVCGLASTVYSADQVYDDGEFGGADVGPYEQEMYTIDGYLRIGVNSSGFYETSGDVEPTVTQDVVLGQNGGSTGTYTQNGNGKLVALDIAVGEAGTGIFNQNGGSVSTNFLGIGVELHDDVSTGMGTGSTGPNSVGTYNLNGGTLRASKIVGNSTFSGSQSTFNFNGGTLIPTYNGTNNDGSTDPFVQTLKLAQVRNGGALIEVDTLNISFDQPIVHSTVSGDNATDGGLTKSGPGSLTLTATNTYNGGTRVNAGTLIESNNGNALSTGTVNIASGATLALNNTSTKTAIYQAGTSTFTGTGTLQKTGAGTVLFGANGGDVNVSLSAGGLIDVEAGTLVGSNSYNGVYNNNQASLNIASGATFDGVEADVRVDALTGAGTLQGGFGDVGNVTIGVANGGGTFTGTIQDSGNSGGRLTLLKTGTGTEILTGANTYTGPTTLSGGVLQAGSAKALGNGGTISFHGGTLQYSAASSGTDFSSRFDSAGNQAISLDTNGQNVTVGYGFGGAGSSLTKLGLGTLTINGGQYLHGFYSDQRGYGAGEQPVRAGQRRRHLLRRWHPAIRVRRHHRFLQSLQHGGLAGVQHRYQRQQRHLREQLIQ